MPEPSSETLIPKRAIAIKGTNLESIGITSLNKERLSLSSEPHPPTICAAVVPSSTAEIEEFSESIIELTQVSRHHGRSYEILSDNQSIWTDQYGIIYGVANLKGNNLEDPRVEKDKNAALGLRINGMQDDREIERIVRASQVLRALGIETERIEAVIRPEELIWQGKIVNIEEFKKLLYQRAFEEKSARSQFTINGVSEKTILDGDLPMIQDYLQNTEFVFTLRDQQVSARARDLQEPKDKPNFDQFISKIFNFINTREKIEAQAEARDARILNPESLDDIKYYFGDYLPKRLAKNIAKLHNAGLTHGFLTDHNVSLAGSIYDLDSVYGSLLELGDSAQPNPKDDIDTFLTSIATMFFKGKGEEEYSYFQTTYGEELAPLFYRTFLGNYLEQRNLIIDPNKVIAQARKTETRETNKTIRDAKRNRLGGDTILAELAMYVEENGPYDQTIRRDAVEEFVDDFIDATMPVIRIDLVGIHSQSIISNIVDEAKNVSRNKITKSISESIDLEPFTQIAQEEERRFRELP